MSEPEPEQEVNEANCRPRGEVLGVDVNELANQYIGAMQAHLDSPEAKRLQAEYVAQQSASVSDTLYMRIVKRQWAHRRWCNVEVLSGLPEHMTIKIECEEESHAVPEVKFKFAQELFRSRTCKTWDEAQRRAAYATVISADVVSA